jgi:hypothetical protein
LPPTPPYTAPKRVTHSPTQGLVIIVFTTPITNTGLWPVPNSRHSAVANDTAEPALAPMAMRSLTAPGTPFQ